MEHIIQLNPATEIAVDEAAMQLRTGTDQAHVLKLAEDMKRRGYQSAHPLLVWEDDNGKWLLVDGFHRRAAAILAGLDKVPCAVFEGTLDEALTTGIAMNMDHGRQLHYPDDFKVAAHKLRARGMGHTAIAQTFWPLPKDHWLVGSDGSRRHPKFNTIYKWFRPAENQRTNGRNTAGRRYAQELEKETGIDIRDDETMMQAVEKASKSEKREAREAGLEEGLAAADAAFNSEREMANPQWEAEGHAPRSGPGTPVLFLSDIHAGEVVDPAEMLHANNAYNWEIMERRLNTVFQTMANLTKRHILHEGYDGMVLVLGGDMVSGEIHEELAETNEKSVLECTFDLAAILAGHAQQAADVFGKVHIVGVPGNHGRLHRKPRAKGYVRTNADYHTYRQIQRMLQDDERFSFMFPLTSDLRFDVSGHRFLLTHGDQFKGGDGMIGPIGPVMRGLHKKRTTAAMLGGDHPFDTMLCGHFHREFPVPGEVMMNGSLKGYDEYAQRGNFQPKPAAQLLFFVHRKHGIHSVTSVYGGE